jgi:hypothetical protein
MYLNSLAEYKDWAAGATPEELGAYWQALSDSDWLCLMADLADADSIIGDSALRQAWGLEK